MLLWSGLFLSLFPLFFGSTLISFLIAGNLFKKGLIKKEIFSPEKILIDTPSSLAIRFSMPYKLLPAGISLQLQLHASHNRTINRTIRVSPGIHENLTMHLPPEKRGEYKGSLSLILHDPIFLFKGRVFLNHEITITVIPKPSTPEESLRPLHVHSNISSQKKENSEDLYEVRKYYPGDDPRKVNWKMFSHSGELFLRIGESGTPKKKRIFSTLLLDSIIPPTLLGAYHDQLTETFLGFLTIFQENGKEIFSILPGEKDWKKINLLPEYTPELSRQTLLQQSIPESFPLPEKEDEFFILSPPDSTVLSPLLSRLGKENHSCHLFIKNYIPQYRNSSSRKTNSIWKTLFIRKNSPSFFSLLKTGILEKIYLRKIKRLENQSKIKVRRGYVKKI